MQKVIIVDDETPARSLLKEYLQNYEEMILIEECNNGVDAVKSINLFKPDLIFLDIQMPGWDGFEVLRRLEEMPKVIFSTAYDQYALQAFDVHAVDYLLKPYTLDRFDECMKRVTHHGKDHSNQIEKLIHSLSEKETYLEKILVSDGNKLINIPLDHIVRIEAEGDYSKLITTTKYYLSNYGITQLEKKMNPKQFIRVHRSSIVNMNKVKEVYKYPASYEIVMDNKDRVKVSKSYLDVIRDLII